jgi:nitrogen-specific signal transduction histidine kinase
MGGMIGFESEPGRTSFWVELRHAQPESMTL